MRDVHLHILRNFVKKLEHDTHGLFFIMTSLVKVYHTQQDVFFLFSIKQTLEYLCPYFSTILLCFFTYIIVKSVHA